MSRNFELGQRHSLCIWHTGEGPVKVSQRNNKCCKAADPIPFAEVRKVACKRTLGYALIWSSLQHTSVSYSTLFELSTLQAAGVNLLTRYTKV